MCFLACDAQHWGLECRLACECQNGGVCDALTGSCLCPSGFTGEHCQVHRHTNGFKHLFEQPTQQHWISHLTWL